MRATGASPHRLTLEVTETHLLEVDDRIAADLRRLRDHGVHVAADDFGTGYSSLQALIQLTVDRLKIDRSFVAALERDPRARSVVQGILGMAHGLQATVVAEGVETAAQARLLQELGCPLGQGYVWARPLPPRELELFLRRFDEDRDHRHPSPREVEPATV